MSLLFRGVAQLPSRGAMAVLSVSMGLLGLYWIRRLRLA